MNEALKVSWTIKSVHKTIQIESPLAIFITNNNLPFWTLFNSSQEIIMLRLSSFYTVSSIINICSIWFIPFVTKIFICLAKVHYHISFIIVYFIFIIVYLTCMLLKKNKCVSIYYYEYLEKEDKFRDMWFWMMTKNL